MVIADISNVVLIKVSFFPLLIKDKNIRITIFRLCYPKNTQDTIFFTKSTKWTEHNNDMRFKTLKAASFIYMFYKFTVFYSSLDIFL